MLEERFMCYIHGGVFKGNGFKEQGCHHQSPPLEDRNIRIKNELYFARKSPRWSEMGVGFITENQGSKAETFARMYLITKEQFEDVVKQENRLDVNSTLTIDYEKLHEQGSQVLFENKFYGKLLCLGYEASHPIYTFTLPELPEAYEKPSEAYLLSIMTGIQDNFPEARDDLLNIIINLKGIKGHYEADDIKALFQRIDNKERRL